MRTFVTSDLHFFHRNIIDYSNRPYRDANGDPDVDAMNEGIISNWNEVVSDGDRVYIIGDVSMGGKAKAPALAECLRRLNGDKYLVPGNHDTWILDSEECMKELTLLPAIYELKVSDDTLPKKGNQIARQTIVLCHYSMRVWHKNGRGAWHLFGHSHGTMDGIGKSFDIGFDGPYSNHRPMSYEQVREIMNTRELVLLDHHNEQTSY